MPSYWGGLALPSRRGRPVHAHGGWRLLSDRMTADIGRHRGGALESAKSRRYVAGNAIFCSDRSSQYTTGRSRVGARQRRAPVVQPHRQLPRQHRSRVVLRHGEERDVLQGKLSLPGPPPSMPSSSSSRPTATGEGPSTIGYKVPAHAMEPFFEHAKPESKLLPIAA